MKKILILSIAVLVVGAFAYTANASHSWGNYHWGRTANPLTLKLGDNMSSSWDTYLGVASADWSASSVLDTTVVAGLSNPKNCKAILGRIEVCNSKYGNNGWLGIAQIWASGSHITQAVTKMNDTYFNTRSYNTPAWRQFVVCQEIGHTFGLDHQDENFGNANLGTCMDYTDRPVDNMHPNPHDYEQLEAIYAHLDSIDTATGDTPPTQGKGKPAVDLDNPSAWGKMIKESPDKKTAVYERDLGNGEKVFTHVIWAE